MSKTYKRIDINGKEENLPKEDVTYIVHYKGGIIEDYPYTQLEFHSHPKDIEVWLNYIDWYLQPIAEKEPIEPQKQEEVFKFSKCAKCGNIIREDHEGKHIDCQQPDKPSVGALEILKRIGYDNDSITMTEIWIAREVYNLALRDYAYQLLSKPEEPQRKGAEEILINAEEIFIKHFSKFRTEPFKSSLDYFISTGHVSGSLFSEIYDYYNEFAQQAIEVSDERSIITSFAKYWNDKLGGEVITYSDISKYLKIKGTKT